MANKWNIPADVEALVRERDKSGCVYCGNPFLSPAPSKAAAPSWEHIINDLSLVTAENIALWCIGCNSSKGQKTLRDWLGSPYCLRRGISIDTLAPVARRHLG